MTARNALSAHRHRAALLIFLAIVLAHWGEHLVQAFQVYVLSWPRADAGGALGLVFPALVHSEALHYGYALVMLVGFLVLLPGFAGRSRTWWSIALWIQVWHHLEHLLLLVQAVSGMHLLGMAAPTSLIQLVVPRIELHLFYNAIVFAPMVVAMVLHRMPNARERESMSCTCAAGRARVVTAAS